MTCASTDSAQVLRLSFGGLFSFMSFGRKPALLEVFADDQLGALTLSQVFDMGPIGSYDCPQGYTVIFEASTCEVAAAHLGYTFDDTTYGDWEGARPSGCFHHQPTQRVYLNNKYTGGLKFGNDRRLCQKDAAASSVKIIGGAAGEL